MDSGKYFVAKRPDSSHLGGKWEFPGGKIEDGETHRQALEREMSEEFCVQTAGAELIGDVLHQYPDKLIHLFFYYAEITGGKLTPTEHPAVCWQTAEELLDTDLAEADAVFVRKFLSA